jgi:hypothetical protein
MNENHSATRSAAAATRTRSLGYWGGFTAFLFVVLLALFTWVVQRRVAQYESLQQAGGHHLTATKVCLTDRIGGTIALLPAAPAQAGLLFFLSVLFGLNQSRSEVVPSGICRSDGDPPLSLIRRRLPHLFYLPPPVFSFAR